MRSGCLSCIWFGSCDGVHRCEYYEPAEDTQSSVESAEEKSERAAFRREWNRYANRDSDVDYTENAVRSCDGGRHNNKGGD